MGCIEIFDNLSSDTDNINDKESNIDVVDKLNDIYENYSIYRTIIVCDNNETAEKLYATLNSHDFSVFQLSSENELINFSKCTKRIMIIHFMQMYRYPHIFKKYAFDDGYLWLLNDLNDLQENCCVHQVRSMDSSDKKIYVSIV
jgi:hypothetical protein